MEISPTMMAKDHVEIEPRNHSRGEVLTEHGYVNNVATKHAGSVLWELIRQYLEKRGYKTTY